MTIVSSLEAQTTLTQLLPRVAAGEEVLITDGRRPVARLVALHSSATEAPAPPTTGDPQTGPMPESEEEEARPWRGILVLDQPHVSDSGLALNLPAGPIPAREQSFDILWQLSSPGYAD